MFAVFSVLALIFGIGFLFIVIGGLMTSVHGCWKDEEDLVVLHQRGPWLFGKCIMSEDGGGEHLFWGLCFFGSVWLSRKTHGANYLLRLGFSSASLDVVQGRANAMFRFRLVGNDTLKGMFVGKHFYFNQEQTQIRRVHDALPIPREWKRVRGPGT